LVFSLKFLTSLAWCPRWLLSLPIWGTCPWIQIMHQAPELTGPHQCSLMNTWPVDICRSCRNLKFVMRHSLLQHTDACTKGQFGKILVQWWIYLQPWLGTEYLKIALSRKEETMFFIPPVLVFSKLEDLILHVMWNS
jgi:hypothetical protein